MRSVRPLIAALALVAAPAFAQQPPANLEPVPAVPPPPPEMVPFDNAIEPQVTIKKRDKETVAEYRIGGKLYMIKVTPENGPPYYLVDQRGDGTFTRQNPLDTGLRVPQWVIKDF